MRIIYRSSSFSKLKIAKLQRDSWFDSGLKVDRFVRNYSLKDKTVSLFFIKGNCHKVADPTLGCSLFLDEQENLSDHTEYKKADPKHCPYIYYLMQNESFRMFPNYKSLSKKTPIRLYRCICGHYETGQGQHRLCISGTLGIPLSRILLSVSERVCEACANPHSAFNLYTF